MSRPEPRTSSMASDDVLCQDQTPSILSTKLDQAPRPSPIFQKIETSVAQSDVGRPPLPLRNWDDPNFPQSPLR